ncbi:serine/threonine-protein phosphatase 6 regulatory ankyrin repeat subunit A-like [Schistocerca gregaria]|uniref:serine/threonine-protein phosphatase 6 regulatory ankyrin repeat subunit A-like n=1 Tax=Schistocerca gregaria TaxID=7010 RepID=UPI00211E734E|nr:serine/threonine-protein phosphatase 6 regulatory ankyrin repeat subunit A-like [Schistocerca gregaria]
MWSADLYAQDESGATALHCAVYLNGINCIELLIGAGIDIGVQDGKWRTVIQMDGQFALCCSRKSAQLLLSVDDLHLSATPLNAAAKADDGDIIIILTSVGANLKAYDDDDGMSALHYAALQGCVHDVHGKTALHYAACRDRVEYASVSVSDDTDVNMWDKVSVTPLHYATEETSSLLSYLMSPVTFCTSVTWME